MAVMLDYQVTVCEPRVEYHEGWDAMAGVTLSTQMPDDLVLAMRLDHNSAVVAVTHDPKLAGLLGDLKIDQEIPKHLYTAVAVILSWAYWLKGMRPGDEKIGADKNQASV